MNLDVKTPKPSVFKAAGFKTTVRTAIAEIQELYRADSIPWVVGYSGGKDSTATLQLIWRAISELPGSSRQKPIYVISTDTLVENPIVSSWVAASLKTMGEAAAKQALPFSPHRLLPELKDRFWVNMIGKGYPAPRPKFRWCTERLKINPSNNFIRDVVQQHGEVILALGTRKAESSARASSIEKYSVGAREKLQRHGQLDRSWVYAPIADWSNDDVWQFLMQSPNPWGVDNKHLLGMYQGATADGECPLVVDTSTPSCGDSRFGCYVCTMVTEDKSMKSMIANDSEKNWMQPLLQFRNTFLGNLADRPVREFRRMNGSLFVHAGRLVHGPYTQAYRAKLLEELLLTEKAANLQLPEEMPPLELITEAELAEIRRIWVEEKYEIEDLLPAIVSKTRNIKIENTQGRFYGIMSSAELEILATESTRVEGDSTLHYELIRNLIATQSLAATGKGRARVLDDLDRVVDRHAFSDSSEALEIALSRLKSGSFVDSDPDEEEVISSPLVQISTQMDANDLP